MCLPMMVDQGRNPTRNHKKTIVKTIYRYIVMCSFLEIPIGRSHILSVKLLEEI